MKLPAVKKRLADAPARTFDSTSVAFLPFFNHNGTKPPHSLPMFRCCMTSTA
jgi:hypothetical protein